MEQSRGRQVAAASLALLAVCGLLMISVFEVEHSGELVREEAVMWSEADEQEAARSSSHWTSRIEKANAMSLMDSESVDHSANAIGKQLQKSVAKVHDVNHKARQAKRDAAAESAGSVVKVQIEQMKKEVAKQSQDAADKAAKATAAATAKAPKKAHVASTKDKIKLLRKDDAILAAAVAELRKQAEGEKEVHVQKAKKFQAVVKAKVQAAKKHFGALKSKLHKYSGTTQKQHQVEHHASNLGHTLTNLNTSIKAIEDRLKRMKQRQADLEKTTKEKVATAKSHLGDLLNKYKGNIAGLKEKLAKVTGATDINSELATRISEQEGLKAEQVKRMGQLNEDVGRLKEQLKTLNQNIQVFSKKAKQRHHLLHVARTTMVKLKVEEKKLREEAEAAQNVKTVQVNTPRGATKVIAKKVVRKVVAAVKKAAKGQREALVKAAVEAATKAAKKRAKKMVPKPNLAVPDHVFNDALDSVGKDLSILDDPVLTGKSASKPKPKSDSKAKPKSGSKASATKPKAVPTKPKAADELFEIGDDKVGTGPSEAEVANDHAVHQALENADETLAELNLNGISNHQLHKAELLAHVAHVLFAKAMATGNTKDKAAAKAAIKAAVGAHSALGHQ